MQRPIARSRHQPPPPPPQPSESSFSPTSDVAGASASIDSSWDNESQDASVIYAYVLWATFGLFGAHHFYLGRDKHAVLWFLSFGGCGIGWLRDFYRLPNYVQLANKDWATMEMLRTSQRVNARPPWSFLHVFAQCMFAWWFGTLATGCIDAWATLLGWEAPTLQPVPDLVLSRSALSDWMSVYVILRLLKMAARCVGVVVAVWLVGTVNNDQRARRGLMALGAVAGQVATVWAWQTRDRTAPKDPDDTPDDLMTLQNIDTSWYSILTVVAIYYLTREWIRIPPLPSSANGNGVVSIHRPRTIGRACRRLLISFTITSLLFISLGTFTLTAVPFETDSGESVTLLQAWRNFQNSPAYHDIMAALSELYREWQQHGTKRTFERFKQEFDVDGTSHAYQVLELDAGETDMTVIKAAHRRLVLIWHPDKHPDKELATVKFQQIQAAYETIEKHLNGGKRGRGRARQGATSEQQGQGQTYTYTSGSTSSSSSSSSSNTHTKTKTSHTNTKSTSSSSSSSSNQAKSKRPR